ncbi:MAG: AAA family ATPase [Longimicrobiales bacterium]
MITRLQVANFKSFRELAIPMSTRNILIGPNMAGKSNFLTVLRFLNLMVRPASGVHGLNNAINTLAPGGAEELLWRGGDSRLVSIAAAGDFREFEDRSEADTWQYKLDLVLERQGTARVQNESLEVAINQRRAALIDRDHKTGNRILRNLANDHAHTLEDVERSALEFEIPGWEGNSLRNYFASIQFVNLVPSTMKQLNSTAAVAALNENGGNLSSWLMTLQTRFRSSFDLIERATRDVLPDVKNILTWPTQQATVLVASEERFLKSPVPVWQMSDGELCFIALLSLVLGPPELTARLYCIEEPENHLHPKLLQTLIGLLDQRQTEAGKAASQIVATTHSLELVDKCRLEDLVLLEKRQGASVCSRPSERRELRQLLEREELGLGELYYSGALAR